MEDQDSTRLQLTLHYDGSGFHGWQFQPDVRTVQGDLEAALGRLADRGTSVLGSGRTDAGVHAEGQVAAVDMPVGWTAEKLRRSLNAILPDDIWVSSARAVRDDFHPRYDAVERTYHYRLGTAPESASPFNRRWCWPLSSDIDPELLERCAEQFVGRHDFRSFAKSGQPERGYTCTIGQASWAPWELGHVFRISADRFLHHMVRYLVGTTVDVARGVRPLEDVSGLLAGRSELETSPPAPPQGLFLTRVRYPDAADTAPTPSPSERRSHAPA